MISFMSVVLEPSTEWTPEGAKSTVYGAEVGELGTKPGRRALRCPVSLAH